MTDAIRRALIEGDWRALVALSPHLPAPPSDHAAEAAMHHARTQACSVPMRLRAWSHRWLTERGLPSGLPDILRPRAERLYPVAIGGVGISCNASSPLFKPIVGLVQRGMEAAVLDVYADTKHRGHPDPLLVRGRMREARERTVKKLLGI